MSNEWEKLAQHCNPSGNAGTEINRAQVSTVIYRLIIVAEQIKDKSQHCFYIVELI